MGVPRNRLGRWLCQFFWSLELAYVSIRQHTSAYVSIRQQIRTLALSNFLVARERHASVVSARVCGVKAETS